MQTWTKREKPQIPFARMAPWLEHFCAAGAGWHRLHPQEKDDKFVFSIQSLSVPGRTNGTLFHLDTGMVPSRSMSGLSIGADRGQHSSQQCEQRFFQQGLGFIFLTGFHLYLASDIKSYLWFMKHMSITYLKETSPATWILQHGYI